MIILWLVSVWLLAKYLPLPKALSGNLLWRLLLSLALSLIFFSALAVVFYFAHIPSSPLLYLLLLLAGTVAVVGKFPANSLKPGRQDLSIALPAVIVVLFFGVNIFLDGYGKHNFSQTAILQSISKAEDDASNHLMLFSRFFMNGNQSLTYDSYTAGYEWSTALLMNATLPSWLDPPAIYLVDFYVVFKLLTFGVMFLSLSLLLYQLYQKYIHRQLTLKHHFLLAILSLSIGLFIFAPLYRNGFYSFLPIIIYIMMIITLLSTINNQNTKKLNLSYVLVLTIGIATSWFMAVPVALLTAGIIIFYRLKPKVNKVLIPLMVAALIILALIIIMLFTAGTIASAGEALALGGGYPTLPRAFVLGVLILAIIFIFKNRPSLKHLKNLESLYLLIAAGFVVALYLYYQLTSGALTYYYLKVETSVLVALLPAAVIYTLAFFKKANFNWQYTVLAVFAGLYGISQLFSANDYLQYITDWNNKAATLEVNAAAPIVQKLSRPINDPAHQVCTIIINKTYIETINADHIANNTTNRLVENHCLPKNYLEMHNSGALDYQVFVQLAERYGVDYQLYTSELGGGPIVTNVSDAPNVQILSY